MSFFGVPFWQSLVTTVVGVFAGAHLALWTERRRSERGRVQKGREVLRLVRGAIQRDRVVLTRIREIVDDGHAPSQRLFPGHYSQALYAGGLDVFRDPKLWGRLANIPPMLDHVNRRLCDVSTIELQQITDGIGKPAVRKLLEGNKTYIMKELQTVLEKTANALDDLESDLAERRVGLPSESEDNKAIQTDGASRRR